MQGICIFTLSGEIVYEADVSNQSSWIWYVQNKKGEKIARGVYIYLVTNSLDEKKIREIANKYSISSMVRRKFTVKVRK